MRIDNSAPGEYYSQRNNRILPYSACNVTAAVGALVAAGRIVPHKKGEQAEDALMEFINTDSWCLKKWHDLDTAGKIPPQEYHAVLALGINRWIGDDHVDDLIEGLMPFDILDHLKAGGTCIVSGVFPTTKGHFVAVVGAVYDDKERLEAFIIDDPWGNYLTRYADQRGDGVEMPFADWARIIRPEGAIPKRVHLIRRKA